MATSLHQQHENQPQESLGKPSSSSSSSSSSVVVVIVPFPAQSHLNQLLQLSHMISSHNYNKIPVHYVGSSLHNSQAKSRATFELHKRIQFHDFPIPYFPSPLPNDTKFPSHLMPSFQASVNNLQQPVKALLTSLSQTTKRIVVIHDLLMSSVVQDASSLPNAEAYVYHSVSAISDFAWLLEITGIELELESLGLLQIPSLEGCLNDEFEAFMAYQIQFLKRNKSGHFYNSCRLIESYFLDFILEREKERSNDENVKLWAIGPLETVTNFKERSSNKEKGYHQHKCLEWLGKQERNSVLYISFGTTTFMKDEQIRELAIGLEQSEVKFLWVLKDADKGNVFHEEHEIRRPQLPLGFEERVKGRGIVVRDWAPQLEILGHSSTGGFMSHCGWNSCLESMSLGVPIATWPMHSDQPMNVVLITELLKVGVVLREWKEKEELVSSKVIEKVAKKLMKSEEGEEVRKRAEELGNELRKAAAEGGVSRMELDSFIAHITR